MKKLICVPLLFAVAAMATETENHGIRILPPPGTVKVDGKAEDWDLSGGIFACSSVETLRDHYGVWFHAMYDAKYLYTLTRWNDPSPLNNPRSSKGDYGFAGDCLQVRFITNYEKGEKEKVSHWTCWRDVEKIDTMDVAYGRKFKSGKIRNAIEKGALMAFQVRADGKGYNQEMAIPWSLIVSDGTPLKADDELRIAIEPNYTAGPIGRISVKGIFLPGVKPDRVFTFRSYNAWGKGVLQSKGNVKPQDLRLADSRTFKVTMEKGEPTIDWTGLIESDDPKGFKKINFETPGDGYVSLNIYDANGKVVRQLLNWAFRTRGKHEVLWDGLTTPYVRKPGSPVEAGKYTWKAIWHPGIGMRLRGFACNAGRAPWDIGRNSNWGGDHGYPSAVTTDGERIFLGWSGAEAGKALVTCDLDANVLWRHSRGGMGGAGLLGVDGGVLYASDHNRLIFCVNAVKGGFTNWEGKPVADLPITDIWPDRKGMPQWIDGLDASDGKVYITCASARFKEADVKDWKKVLTMVFDKEGLGAQIHPQVHTHWTGRMARRWKNKIPDDWQKKCKKPGHHVPGFMENVTRIFNKMLNSDNLSPEAKKLTGDARQQANRKAIEAAFPGCFIPMRTNFLAVLDGRTGKLEKFIDIPMPRRLCAVNKDLVYVVAGNGTQIAAVNPSSGSVKTIVNGLSRAVGVTADAEGRILVSVHEPDHQIKIFTKDGNPAGEIGVRGGRGGAGVWNPNGVRKPAGMVVDKLSRLWVTEATTCPKRISVWDLKTGKLVKELFGPTHYGASGGAILPEDPNIMLGEGCEWKLDPKTGRATCTGVMRERTDRFARFCRGKNGKTYVITTNDSHAPQVLDIFERLGEGHYKQRARISSIKAGKKAHTEFWSDANDDARAQPNEVTKVDGYLNSAGFLRWSIFAADDLTIYGVIDKNPVRIPVAEFTACHAPKFATDKTTPIPAQGLPSLDQRLLLQWGKGWLHCHDLKKNEEVWSYPNPFSGVHGSHRAPPPKAGLLRGAFGIIGTATLPRPLGTIWALNSNVGEWHVLTEDGFYLTRLFEGDPFKQKFPDDAVPGAVMDTSPPGLGAEDFGGSMVQGKDGKVYIQAGKTGLWNIEVVGLEEVKAIKGGGLTIEKKELALARKFRDEQLQAAVGVGSYSIKRKTIAFTGNLGRDFQGTNQVRFAKQKTTGVTAAAAWDEMNLYLGWQVKDPSPWVNGADAPIYMYARGDTVDFQLGTDAQAKKGRADPQLGDLRLSIGDFKGKPTAVIYRKVAKVKKPQTFSSGVIAAYKMDSVVVLEAVNIKVMKQRNGYTVEAAIPLKALGFSPKAGLTLKGDFGVTHGDQSGGDTQLRTHWNNQQTGLVSDEVFELKVAPKNWGLLTFQ